MKFKKLILLSTVAFLICAAVPTITQANPPNTQPTWYHFGKALEAGIAFSAGSLTSRLWITSKMLVIVCKEDAGKGTLEPTGKDKNEISYKGCKPFKPEENGNSPKQFEEGTEYEKCEIKTAGAAAGEIVAKTQKTRLVWWVEANDVVLDLYEPEAQPFVTIEILGAECTVKGTYTIDGSVVGRLQSYSTATKNEEAIMGNQLFEVGNIEEGGRAVVRQGHRRWLVENGGAGKEGTAELSVLEGSTKTPVAFESAEQIELNRVSNKRGLYAAHE